MIEILIQCNQKKTVTPKSLDSTDLIYLLIYLKCLLLNWWLPREEEKTFKNLHEKKHTINLAKHE